MNWLLSLLLVACVCGSTVVAIFESDQQVIIAKQLTAAAAASLSAAASASHSSRTGTAQTFAAAPGSIPGLSDACTATTVSLESNSAIKAARASVIESGCTDPDTQGTCDLSARTCTCIATYSNDANFRSLVAQSGGQVCTIGMQFIATTADGFYLNFSLVGGLGPLGSSCTNNDIKAILSYGFDTMAEGLRENNSKKTANNKIQSISGTFSMCGTSYTGTRSTNGAYNNKPVGCAIVFLIGIIITIINQAL